MTLAAVGGYPPRRSSRPFSPAAKSSSASLLISLDLDSPSVPSYHATTQTSAVFLLTLLELSPPSLRRYIDPPLPLPSRYETTGTQMDLESLLFLCKDVLATVCPKLLETKSWERLVHNVLLSCDGSDDSDYDDDIPIFQSEWEKQWEYSDEEDDPLDAVSNIVLEGRGRQGYSSSSHWETIDRRGQMVLSPEFDDVVKVGDRDPDAEETWHDASDRIGCMDLVSRVCEMIAEWEDDGDSVRLAFSRAKELLLTNLSSSRLRSLTTSPLKAYTASRHRRLIR